jgi:hypothetical protein
MRMNLAVIALTLCICHVSLGQETTTPLGLTEPRPASTAQRNSDGSVGLLRDCWVKAPTVSIMTGFIYEPLKPYTIQKWMEDLGNRFDADVWVKDFREAGASHLVFYDKWIDGLVFHDTKTTGFKTKRDFLRELAAACQRGGLPLVIYFNAVSDGNPEFDPWATLDRQGKPIVFAPQWPTRYQTLHSPFRQKAVEQVREILSNYGPIHGIWHDIFAERLNTSSPWVAKGYERMFGEPFDKASPARLAEFNARTLAGYLDEIDAVRRRQRQDQCVFTSNGSGGEVLWSGLWADLVGSRLQYLYQEGHSFTVNDELAQMAWVLPKPLDICLLLNRSWFTPLDDAALPACLTRKQAIATTAIAVCQGAGVNLALTPGHSGVFGEDLKRAKAVGAWFRQVKPYVENARPHADVAIILGTPAADAPGLPAAGAMWTQYRGRQQHAWQGTLATSDALARCGTLSRTLYLSAQGGSWPDSLRQFRAVIVPELAALDRPHLDQLRHYVEQGGRLIAFGHASLLDEKGQPRKDYGLGDVLGARFAGEVVFPAAPPQAAIRVDSEYDRAFGAHVLAGGVGEAWASAGTPMPHWVEVTLPEPVEVARIVLVNRAGPYQVTDFSLAVDDQGRWRPVKSVRGAAGREMAVTLSPAARTGKIRVEIQRELYENKDRQYADLAAIRVIDAKGRCWVGGPAARLPLTLDDPEVARAFGDAPSAWVPMAVRVELTSAKTVATLQGTKPAAAILANRFGRGMAYLITAGDGAFERDDPFWTGLARLAAGEPTLQVSPEDARRYRIILTRVAGAHVLHVIDSQADSPAAPPRPVSISLSPERLGGLSSATLVGVDRPLTLSSREGRVGLVVQPDPVATVIMK